MLVTFFWNNEGVFSMDCLSFVPVESAFVVIFWVRLRSRPSSISSMKHWIVAFNASLKGDIVIVGGLGGREPFARKESRVAKAIVLAALIAGRRRGLFPGKKPLSIDGIVRTSRRCAVAHHFYPQFINSYVVAVGNK